MILTVILPMKARATCESQLSECNEVLEVADRAIKVQQNLIGMQADQISDLKFNYNIVKNQLQEVERDRNSWYRNPMIIVPLSFVLGAVVYSQATK